MLDLELLDQKPPDYIQQKEEVYVPVVTQPPRYDYPIPEMPHPIHGWVPAPPYSAIDNACPKVSSVKLVLPPGLEYLTTVEQLLVHQKVELFETITGFESNNKYTVKNCLGQKVFLALEDSNWFNRMGGPMRPFEMKILSTFGEEVIHLHRPLACHGCICPFWLQRMVVAAPPGQNIGAVEQEWSLFRPMYVVKDSMGETVLKIRGPTCRFSFAVEFAILTQDEKSQVGKIVKHWSGLAREIFTDADYFGITFPMDLDVKLKAVLLGACFLIDFMFFED